MTLKNSNSVIMDQNVQEINSISTIFQMYFKHSQRYIQRINYSMFEYRTHSIPFRKRCFRALFYFSTSLYMAFIMIMATYIPYIRFFLEIEQQMLGFKDIRLYGSFSGVIILMDTYKWYSTFQKLINYRYPLNEILIKLDQTVDENLNTSNRQTLIQFFAKSFRFTFKLNTLFKYGFYLTSIKMTYILTMEFLEAKISINQLLIGILTSLLMFSNIDHFIMGISMELIYLVFSLGYLKINMRQLIGEVRKWKSIRNRRMAIFQKDFRRYYLRHYCEMVHFRNMQGNFLMFIELMSKSLCMIIVISCAKTTKFNVNTYFMIAVFIMTFIYAEIVFIAISSFPKYNEKFFKMLYDWNARNLSQLIRTNIIKFKRIICLREIIKRNLFLQAISRNSYGFYFGQKNFLQTLSSEQQLYDYISPSNNRMNQSKNVIIISTKKKHNNNEKVHRN
ncbi:hypothetical protein DERP_010402 [Dermatophagoides pteronyssinus]|uniref:Odorant receptor n=1 Tax=Dermatophagoides pteronyssinus TaxID=6956 RepID=A0ABQ8J4Z2_DERPT|nr:hypothetical protein DERP_010402 [Dermatophagoides pteronyssinus]